jgi:protein MpaA
MDMFAIRRLSLTSLFFCCAQLARAEEPLPTSTPSNTNNVIQDFCLKIGLRFAKFGWQESGCNKIAWNYSISSEKGAPLIFAEFGRKTTAIDPETETTLILGGVHGDETPSTFMVFREAAELQSQDAALSEKNKRVVVAPLVNPDGFFLQRRTNANGVDLNRNLPTTDWSPGALRLWKIGRKGSPIHFPGHKPGSEAGSMFQVYLIERYTPDKILSIHAPLNFIDYDGPGDAKRSSLLNRDERRAKEIAAILGRTSRRRKVVDYPFFPGSLGNFAGNERGIPTITLEVASSQPRYAARFWDEFRESMANVIDYKFRKLSVAQRNQKNN